MNFLQKRSQIAPPPGADHGRVRSVQPGCQCLVKMAEEADSSVSGEEGHSGKK